MKVKVSDLSLEGLEEVKRANIKKAQDFMKHSPYSNAIYLAMKTNLPIDFILDNRKEIGV